MSESEDMNSKISVDLKFFKSVPVAEKTGVLVCGDKEYFCLYKRVTSTKPYAYIKMDDLIGALQYIEDEDNFRKNGCPDCGTKYH